MTEFDSYSGKTIILTSQHHKEKAIALPMMAIGARLETYSDFDTDLLGTFSGEIERDGTAHEVAERKARIGMKALSCSFGIANEGSFGPHPYLPFGCGGLEIIAFVDDENGCVYFEEFFTADINYSQTVVSSFSRLREVAQLMGFPTHGLILAPAAAEHVVDRDTMMQELGLVKGIITEEKLEETFSEFCTKSPVGCVWVETDMRAHFNPTRMRSIRKVATMMAKRLRSQCPQCKFPGFGLTSKEAGVKCANCGTATEVVGWYVNECHKCKCVKKIPKYDEHYRADPQYCPSCNP